MKGTNIKAYRRKLEEIKKSRLQEADAMELTESRVLTSRSIREVRRFAKLVGITGKYTSADIVPLKNKIVARIRLNKRDDLHIMGEYQIIEEFISAYDRKPDLPQIYGEAGFAFKEIWDNLPMKDKKIFQRDYETVYSKRLNLNPLAAIEEYISKRPKDEGEDLETLHDFVELLEASDYNFENKDVLEASSEISQSFLDTLKYLTPEELKDYVSLYLSGKKSDPNTALFLYIKTRKNLGMNVGSVSFNYKFSLLTQEQREEVLQKYLSSFETDLDELLPKDEGNEKYKIKELLVATTRTRPRVEVDRNNEDIKKCQDLWIKEKFMISPLLLPDDCIGELVSDTPLGKFYEPTYAFYDFVCKYHTHPEINSVVSVLSPRGDKFIIAKRDDNMKPKLYKSFIELSNVLERLDTSTMTYKKDPIWVLNLQLKQLPSAYIDEIELQLGVWMRSVGFGDVLDKEELTKLEKLDIKEKYKNNRAAKYTENITKNTKLHVDFSKEFEELRQTHWNDRLIVYYASVLEKFAPFIPNVPQFQHLRVLEQLKKGYISPAAFVRMDLSYKIPGIPVEDLRIAIIDYTNKIAEMLVSNVHSMHRAKTLQSAQKIESLPDGSTKRLFDFPTLEIPNIRDYSDICDRKFQYSDMIVNPETNKCYPISHLLNQFVEEQVLYHDDFSEGFRKYVISTFGHLISAKFQYSNGEDYYTNKEIYELSHRVEETKKQEIKEDISEMFNKFFSIETYADPIGIIESVMRGDIGDIKCKRCDKNAKMKSIIQQSNGELVPIYFCSVDCLDKHEFVPEYNAEEEKEEKMDINDVINSVEGNVDIDIQREIRLLTQKIKDTEKELKRVLRADEVDNDQVISLRNTITDARHELHKLQNNRVEDAAYEISRDRDYEIEEFKDVLEHFKKELEYTIARGESVDRINVLKKKIKDIEYYIRTRQWGSSEEISTRPLYEVNERGTFESYVFKDAKQQNKD